MFLFYIILLALIIILMYTPVFATETETVSDICVKVLSVPINLFWYVPVIEIYMYYQQSTNQSLIFNVLIIGIEIHNVLRAGTLIGTEKPIFVKKKNLTTGTDIVKIIKDSVPGFNDLLLCIVCFKLVLVKTRQLL